MQLLRNVVRVGSSRAVIIPAPFFESLKNKGKTFSKVKLTLNDKIIMEPVLEDIS